MQCILLKEENKMKKIGFLFATVVMMLLFAVSSSAATKGYYTYKVKNGKATITDVDTSISGYVAIPSTLGGYSVTSIGESAFSGCKNIKKMAIPDSVDSIGDNAFNDCDSLEDIYYSGEKSQWRKIKISKHNDFSDVKIHYNHKHNFSTTSLKKATVSKNGKKVKQCNDCGYTKTSIIYYPKTIKLESKTYKYNGKVKMPTVTVENGKGESLSKSSYVVTYEKGRKLPGRYTVKITFKGSYSGTKRLYFTVKPKKVSGFSAKKTTYNSVTLKWNKVNYADGYKIYKYDSRKKKFISAKEVTGTSVKITDLKAETSYRFRIKAYIEDEGKIYSDYSTELKVKTKSSKTSEKALTLKRKKINISSAGDTEFYYNFFANAPYVVSFVDSKGYYSVTSFDGEILHIYRYDKNLKLKKEIRIKKTFQLFGNITCDDKGNYYVCWGRADSGDENIKVISVVKYDYDGNKVASKSFKGNDLITENVLGGNGGTRIPFDAGTCKMAINNGILSCNFAREMYNGHQSNMVFYLNCETMKVISGVKPYCSHSFDQSCIATSDGGFLLANQGDAYPRGFLIDKVDSQLKESKSITTFNFREGTNRPYGYNETFAQLGGVAETENGYVLCAASERTLSLSVKKNNNESRDLFVQILKKDFYNYDGAAAYYAKGSTRKATGKRSTEAKTELQLTGKEKNYGVIWLTDYGDKYFVANPKILSINRDKIFVIWEKRNLSDDKLENCYYVILNEDGSIYKKTTKIGKYALPTDADVVLNDGKIYWATRDRNGVNYINILDLSKSGLKIHLYEENVIPASLTEDGEVKVKCKQCGHVKSAKTIYSPTKISVYGGPFIYNGEIQDTVVVVKDSKGKLLTEGVDYTVTYLTDRKSIGEHNIKVAFKGIYSGSKIINYKIVLDTVRTYYTPQDVFSYAFLRIGWYPVYGADGYIVEYSTSEDFTKETTETIIREGDDNNFVYLEVEFNVRIRAYKEINGSKVYGNYTVVENKYN